MRAEAPSRYDQKLVYVLKTSAAVFAEQGYHSTSMRDISRATEMSLSGLYYYFKSKQELLYLIQDNCFTTVMEDCLKLIDGIADPIERLKLFIENHLNYFVNNMNEMKVLSHEADSIEGDLFRKINAKKRQYVDLMMEILNQISDERKTKRVDVRIATFSLFGMMNWIYNWYDPRRDVDVQGLATNMTRLFLSGFLGDQSLESDSAQTTRRPHLERNVSIWQQ